MKYQDMIKEGLNNAKIELTRAQSLADELEDMIGEITDDWVERNYPDSALYPLSTIHLAIQLIAQRLEKGLNAK